MPKKSITTKSRTATKAKPIEAKSKTLKGCKQKPIEKPPKKSVGPSPFEKAMAVFEQHFIGAEQKTGFELYRFFREALFAVLSTPKKAIALSEGNKSVPDILFSDLALFEQAYMDNFIVSMAIKQSAPEMYSTLSPIIDSYIKPKKLRQGIKFFHETMSGLFVYLLTDNKGASSRQLEHLASQIFGINLSYVASAYLRINKNKPDKKRFLQGNLFALVPLYGALVFLGKNLGEPSAIKADSPRSEKEFSKAKLAYSNLTKGIISKHLPTVTSFVQRNPDSFIALAASEYGIKPKKNAENPKLALYALIGAFFIKHIPSKAAEII
jgi:hypothetical protein